MIRNGHGEPVLYVVVRRTSNFDEYTPAYRYPYRDRICVYEDIPQARAMRTKLARSDKSHEYSILEVVVAGNRVTNSKDTA